MAIDDRALRAIADAGRSSMPGSSGWKSTSRRAMIGQLTAAASAQPTSGTRQTFGKLQWRHDPRRHIAPSNPVVRNSGYAFASCTQNREKTAGATNVAPSTKPAALSQKALIAHAAAKLTAAMAANPD